MGNLLPKLIHVETTTKESSNKNMERLKHLAHEFLGINGRQFEALYSCVAEEMKDAREQDLARALHSMQEKMDQNSKETATMLSSDLKRVEKVIKDLAAKKSNIPSEEMQQIEAVKDDIRKLKEGVRALNHRMELREMAEDEIKIAKNHVKNTASARNSKLPMKTEDNYNMGEIRDLKEDVDCVNNEMRDVMENLESHEHELEGFQFALDSLQQQLFHATEKLESLNNVATNREMIITSEMRIIKEDLKVVEEKTRGAKDEQRGLTEAGLRKVVTHANLTTESNDKEGRALTDHLQNVGQAMTELEKLINCNNMKRNRDSRYPTFEQNKKLRKQSTRDDEHGIASVSRKIVYPGSTSSSESDSSASALPSKSHLNKIVESESESEESESESDSSASPLPAKANLNTYLGFDSDSSDSDSDSDS